MTILLSQSFKRLFQMKTSFLKIPDNIRKIKSYISLIIIISGAIVCQEIPNEFFDFKVNSFFRDHNLNSWESHTNFGPLRYNNINRYKNKACKNKAPLLNNDL